MKSSAVVVTLMLLYLSGCSWLKSTPGEAQVRVITANDLAGCSKVGTTHVSVADRLALLSRTEGAVV